MRPLDIKLYKAQIISGKEDVAREWLAFLDARKEESKRLLENEKVYLEAYFPAMEGDTMFIYMLLVAKDIDATNATARESTDPFDLKHFEYGKECVEPELGAIVDCMFYMENLADLP